MDKSDLEQLVEIRTHLIAVYNSLEGKSEPSALVKQADIARELSIIIPKIDKILANKVNFS